LGTKQSVVFGQFMRPINFSKCVGMVSFMTKPGILIRVHKYFKRLSDKHVQHQQYFKHKSRNLKNTSLKINLGNLSIHRFHRTATTSILQEFVKFLKMSLLMATSKIRKWRKYLPTTLFPIFQLLSYNIAPKSE
jgi:hypothetical protein